MGEPVVLETRRPLGSVYTRDGAGRVGGRGRGVVAVQWLWGGERGGVSVGGTTWLRERVVDSGGGGKVGSRAMVDLRPRVSSEQ